MSMCDKKYNQYLARFQGGANSRMFLVADKKQYAHGIASPTPINKYILDLCLINTHKS
jgi:hypothetical protein